MSKKEEIIFCNNVRKLREKEKITKKEMATKLGIGLKSLSLLENGILPKRLSAEVVLRISRNFGMKPSEMFSDKLFDEYDEKEC